MVYKVAVEKESHSPENIAMIRLKFKLPFLKQERILM